MHRSKSKSSIAKLVTQTQVICTLFKLHNPIFVVVVVAAVQDCRNINLIKLETEDMKTLPVALKMPVIVAIEMSANDSMTLHYEVLCCLNLELQCV